MKRPLFALTIFCMVGLLLAGPAEATSSIERTITVNGLVRSYLLYIPAGHEKQHLPAFIIFHGGTSSADVEERYTNFDTFASANNLIAIYPEGIEKHWNDGRVNGAQSSADDVSFVSALIDALATDGTLDPKQVYATGISNGGFMALHLACNLSAKIAGIAVVAAAQPSDAACPSPRPMPVIIFHGTIDKFVPFGGGPIGNKSGNRGTVLSDAQTAEFWRNENGCKTSHRLALPDTDPSDGTRVYVDVYDCPRGQGLNNVIIEGGGHTWPGATQAPSLGLVLGPISHDIDANRVMWDFFQAEISGH